MLLVYLMRDVTIPEITVRELKDLIDAGQEPFILDVRETKEYEIANLNGKLIPLKQLVDRLDEIKPYVDELVVVHCRSGGRSAQAVRLLQAVGFSNSKNLVGGTLAWSREIDPLLPTY